MSQKVYETLQVEHEAGVLRVCLNRPDVRNAFNGTVIEELQALFDGIHSAKDVRVVVLEGAGKSFCAGADLTWMKEQAALPDEENAAGAARMARMFLSIARCPWPVVASIHGHALGGGTGLAAAVDVAICTEETVFGLTEVKLGIVPAVISPFVLQKIGAGRARTLFLTGERFDGREAERIGLVHRAVPEADRSKAVAATVKELFGSGPAAVTSAKELIQTIAGVALEDAIPVTSRWIADLRATDEAREGMSAFLERRKPSWL